MQDEDPQACGVCHNSMFQMTGEQVPGLGGEGMAR